MVGKPKERMSAGKWMIPVSSTGPGPISAASPAPALAPPYNGAPPHPQPQIGASLDPISSTIMSLNMNPYVIGMFMLLLNLGGRFLSLELTKKQEAFLQSPWIRPLIFFTVIFIATRNLVAAFWVTLLFFFVIWVVANENSPFCLIPSWCEGTPVKDPAETYESNVEKLTAKSNETPMLFS
jgi:hypothetical protein